MLVTTILPVVTLSCHPNISTQEPLAEEEKRFLNVQKKILERTLQYSRHAQSRIIAYQSQDLQNWNRDSTVVLPHSFTSLGLHHENGHIVLTGQHHVQPPTREEEEMKLTWSQLLHFDEEEWRAEIRVFSYPDITAHADHQWLQNQLWFYAPQPTKEPNTDPIFIDGSHRILSTNPNKLQLSLPYIGDPSPVLLHDKTHVFLTEILPKTLSSAVVYYIFDKETSEQYLFEKRFEGYSNPFAFSHDNEIYLFMQRKEQMISYTKLKDGKWDKISDIPHVHCENPVIGKGKNVWWLFCVQSRKEHIRK